MQFKGSSTINTLRTREPVVLLTELKILLEPTIFGIAISGAVPKCLKRSSQRVAANNVSTRLVCASRDPQLFLVEEDISLAEDISFLWKQEQLGILPKEEHTDDKKAWDLFINSIHRDETTGQFTVRLPFNDKKHMISDNISVAAARTYKQIEYMISNKQYGDLMCQAKKDLDTHDYCERVDPDAPTGNVIYYMPFRGILKTESDTTKCRLVMDASSKPSASHISLNQALYQGPNLIVELSFILLRFMLGKYATIADLEKAFLRIIIASCDRDALRFFWPADPSDFNSKLITYRFKAVMFGSAASPFQLAAVLHVLIQNDCTNKHVKHALLTRIYVDDVAYSNQNETDMVTFFEVSTTTFHKGSFNCRQWASNSPKLMIKAREKDIANENKIVKVLGMYWNIPTDTYLFNINFKWDGKFTKRSALRFCNSIFDPLGLVIPIIIRIRLFIQKLWAEELSWDKSFEQNETLAKEWQHLVQEAHIAVTSTNSRQAIWTNNSEIHIFSDASKDAYGAVVYVRTPPCTEYPKGNVHLVCAKGKVAALDPKLTIPRMELAGAVVAAHKVPYIIKAWEIERKTKFFIWSDAKAVLGWLSQYNIKETYVNNRVNQVRQSCKPVQDTIQIKYVPTKENPADIITREQDAKAFVSNNTWWNGPSWLLDEQNWPTTETTFNLYPVELENTMYLNTIVIDIGKTSLLKFFNEGTFTENLIKMSRVLRFIGNNKKKHNKTILPFRNEVFCKEELDQAKIKAIQLMQRDMFSKELAILQKNQEITTGPYRKWGLHLSPDGVIRCKDRTINLINPRTAHDPILVHGKHPFVESFIKFKHIHSKLLQ